MLYKKRRQNMAEYILRRSYKSISFIQQNTRLKFDLEQVLFEYRGLMLAINLRTVSDKMKASFRVKAGIFMNSKLDTKCRYYKRLFRFVKKELRLAVYSLSHLLNIKKKYKDFE